MRGAGSEDGHHQAVLWQVHRVSHLSVRVPPRLLPHGSHAQTPTGPSPPNGRGTDGSSFYRSCRLMWNLFPFSPQASRIRCSLGCAEVLTTRSLHARGTPAPTPARSHVAPGVRVRLVRRVWGRFDPPRLCPGSSARRLGAASGRLVSAFACLTDLVSKAKISFCGISVLSIESDHASYLGNLINATKRARMEVRPLN